MPQSNESAENINYKLQAKTTAMLLAKMDDNMWSEGIKTEAYVRNMYPHSTTPGNWTPYGVFKKAVPSVKHFRVFGSLCYAVLPIHKRKKFGAKSIKGQFVGYEVSSKSYRVYYAETNQVRIHKDVDFYEAALFPSMKQQHPPHIVKVGELEHYYQLAELPPRPPVAPGQSRLDMYSSDEEDMDLQQIEPHYPIPPISDDDELTLDPAETFSVQEPGGAPSHVHTSEFSPSTNSYSDSESNQSSPLPAPPPAPNRDVPAVPPTRATRLPKGQAPVNYREAAIHTALSSPQEPKTYKEAMRGPEAKQWQEAIDSELDSLKSHCTYSYLPKPPGVKVLPVNLCSSSSFTLMGKLTGTRLG
jgi:hypothetical protein